MRHIDHRLPEVDADPYASENLINPYPMHQRLREAGPVVFLPKYGVYGCARHEQVAAVLGNHATWISSAGVGVANFRTEKPFRPPSLILEADPPQHTQMRAILARVLSPQALHKMRNDFERVAEEMVARCVTLGEIDAIADLAQIYPLKVFPDAVGLEPNGRENLLAYGDMVFNSMGPRNELLARSAARAAEVTEWIMTHCQRAALAPDGFGDQIYQAADRGELTHEQAPMLVRSFLSAGVDTTINGIGNAIYCLAGNPDAYAKLHADPSLARLAFEEALRFESTAQTFFRTAAHDTELAGLPIPENSKLVCFLAAANRDPRKWPNPDHYDIHRRPAGHQAFGSGIHGCVGQVVARLEGELVLSALARRVKAIEMLTPPTRRLNNTLRAIDTMRLRLIPS